MYVHVSASMHRPTCIVYFLKSRFSSSDENAMWYIIIILSQLNPNI